MYNVTELAFKSLGSIRCFLFVCFFNNRLHLVRKWDGKDIYFTVPLLLALHSVIIVTTLNCAYLQATNLNHPNPICACSSLSLQCFEQCFHQKS